MQTDEGVPITGLAFDDITFNYQINTDPAIELSEITVPPLNDTTWIEIGEGLYRFLFTPAVSGMVVYWVEAPTAIAYEGAIDVVPAGLYSTALIPGYYCAYTDMWAEIASLADLIPTGYDPETWVMGRVQKAQEAIVDVALAEKGYVVPVVTPWGILRGITVNAAAYEILRPLKVRQDPTHDADWADTYLVEAKAALALVPPPNPDGTAPIVPESIWGEVSSTTSSREQGPFTLPRFEDEQSETTTTW